MSTNMDVKDLKILAYYLPQFHETEENNKWWGKGYTEWRNARNASPLYGGHYQPREPLYDNYYDLMDDHTMREQAELAKKHGIDGFIFYHYWFMGEKLLHKPAEKLLADSTIDIPFCFAWANHPWSRTWEGPGGEKKILMQQRYGEKEHWIKHFEYLLPFFKDARYIKKDNKPVFLIYAIEQIDHYPNMLEVFHEEAQKAGFDGIYIIQMIKKMEEKILKSRNIQAATTYAPSIFNYSVNKRIRKLKFKYNKCLKNLVIPGIFKKLFYDVFDYDACMRFLMERKYAPNEYMGIYPEFDNTARKGKCARIHEGATPKKFEKYLTQLIRKSLDENKDMLFITAWNEWGEGNYLEPDKKRGYGWLNAIVRARRNNE